MKVKVKPGKSRLVVTLNQVELDIISTALVLVYTSDKYSEKNKNIAERIRAKLPVNIEEKYVY